MKIVVLDGHTLNPGDLDWKELTALGDCQIYDRTPTDLIVDRAKDAEIVLTNKTVLDRTTLEALPNTKYIGVLATGVNVVDTETAKKQSIVVTNAPNYTGQSGAQAVFALLLELTNRVGHHSQTVFENKWHDSPDFCYWDFPLIELDQLTLGIVGYGSIGKNVTKIARAFGMKNLVSTRTVPKDIPEGTEFCDMDRLFSESDVISLHCPLTKATKGLINTEHLKQMKNTAYLINISRGPLVVENDLAEALNNDVIAGAALDVLDKEPPDTTCPLLKAKNCYITPHISWATLASRRRLMTIAINNIKAYLADQPMNIVG